MAKLQRFKTKYPGVFYIEGESVNGKPEKIFYIRYRKDGKSIEEKAGRQFQDTMTPAQAARIRASRIEGKEPTNHERREAEAAKKAAEESRYTLNRLADEYFDNRPDNKAKRTDQGRYNNHIKPLFGEKEPFEIIPLDVDRLRIRLLKRRSPQTVSHVLNLLVWITNFGVKKRLSQGLPFHVEKPVVNNIKTEDLSPEQLNSLLTAIAKSENIQAANMMLMALYTGMRRGEMFRLKWADVDFERGFIHIREPKGGVDQTIPLNDAARQLLESHPMTSEFVFPGRGGKQRTDIKKAVNAIKKKAGLTKDFRALHGLRHVYASMLASSGEVDMYTLQRLLTHKSPVMTQRYAHLRDETLQKASTLAGDIITRAASKKDAEKVVNLEAHISSGQRKR